MNKKYFLLETLDIIFKSFNEPYIKNKIISDLIKPIEKVMLKQLYPYLLLIFLMYIFIMILLIIIIIFLIYEKKK